MSTFEVACLDTRCGPLHISGTAALIAIIEKINLTVALAPTDDTLHKADPHVLVDGSSAESWAQYAKRKSSIATFVCKINGQLKVEIADLKACSCTSRITSIEKIGMSSTKDDSLFVLDSWSKSPCWLKARAGVAGEMSTTSDEWSNWRGHTNEMLLAADVNGSQDIATSAEAAAEVEMSEKL